LWFTAIALLRLLHFRQRDSGMGERAAGARLGRDPNRFYSLHTRSKAVPAARSVKDANTFSVYLLTSELAVRQGMDGIEKSVEPASQHLIQSWPGQRGHGDDG
jgi:hypothetical protein